MKLLNRTLTFAVAALSVGAAYALDKCSPILLYDDGFGSDTTYGFMDYSDDACMILGSKNDMLGRSIPMMWEYELGTGQVVSSPLPTPTGFYGQAMGWAKLPNDETIITGNLTGPDGSVHAYVWRSVNYGAWEMPSRMSPLTTLDICGHEITHGITSHVAGSLFQNGAWRPVVFNIKVNVDISHTLLPAPTGGGMASGMDEGPNGGVAVSGWTLAANGLRKPVVWVSNPAATAFSAQQVQIPNNAGGQVNRVNLNDGNRAGVGDVFRNGRTTGFYMDSSQQLLLQPLGGFQNSTAYSLGDTATHEVGHWMFGGSVNSSGLPAATVWLPLGIGGYGPLPLQSFLTDPSSVSRVTGFRPGTGCVVGSVVPVNSSVSRACVFVPDGQAPDRADVTVGNAIGEGSSDVVAMVHNDGEIYAARTARQGNQRVARIDIEFNPLSFSAGQDTRMDTKVMDVNHVAGGVINVYFFNYATQEFETLYTGVNDGSLLGITSPLPSGATNPSSGQVRIRVEYRHGGGRPRALGIESIEIAHEG